MKKQDKKTEKIMLHTVTVLSPEAQLIWDDLKEKIITVFGINSLVQEYVVPCTSPTENLYFKLKVSGALPAFEELLTKIMVKGKKGLCTKYILLPEECDFGVVALNKQEIIFKVP